MNVDISVESNELQQRVPMVTLYGEKVSGFEQQAKFHFSSSR